MSPLVSNLRQAYRVPVVPCLKFVKLIGRTTLRPATSPTYPITSTCVRHGYGDWLGVSMLHSFLLEKIYTLGTS